ncbi:hypothetical protein Agub_g10279, partial [Astrephomene gubernaculifera]
GLGGGIMGLHARGGGAAAAAASMLAARAAAAGAHGAARLGPSKVPLPKIIALAPGALPTPTLTSSSSSAALLSGGKAALAGLVGGLASVAVAAGRTLGLPRLGCEWPWMHRPEVGSLPFSGRHIPPWSHLDGEVWAVYNSSTAAGSAAVSSSSSRLGGGSGGNSSSGSGGLSCEWLAWAHHGCLHGPTHLERRGHGHANPHPAARMLLSIEMEHLLQQLPPEHRTPRPPGPDGAGGNTLAVPPGASAGSDGVYEVRLTQLAEALSRLAPELPVVWLEQPMRVTDLTGPLAAAHQHWSTHCCGMSWPRSVNHICFGRY